jgi:hypothetical protein
MGHSLGALKMSLFGMNANEYSATTRKMDADRQTNDEVMRQWCVVTALQYQPRKENDMPFSIEKVINNAAMVYDFIKENEVPELEQTAAAEVTALKLVDK